MNASKHTENLMFTLAFKRTWKCRKHKGATSGSGFSQSWKKMSWISPGLHLYPFHNHSKKNIGLWNESSVAGILCRSPNPSYHTFIILNLFHSPEIKENRRATWFFAYRKRTLSNETQLITSLQILTSLDNSFLSIKQIHFCFPGGLNYLSALGLFSVLDIYLITMTGGLT